MKTYTYICPETIKFSPADPALATTNSATLRNNGIYVATVAIGNAAVAHYSYGVGFFLGVPNTGELRYYTNNFQTILCKGMTSQNMSIGEPYRTHDVTFQQNINRTA